MTEIPESRASKQQLNVASKKIIAAPYKLKNTDKYPLFLHSLNVGFFDTDSRYAPMAAIKPVIVTLNEVTIPNKVVILAGSIAGKSVILKSM
ncbi:hypothetical protein [Vibrio taketomensis]|uniref:hypothetical protein n=1 Tax=Vibrio taketomensis TaxID=2572923 RepID=UPI001389AB21|nr:hypothetical protein [Vibrio taketomensis]